MVIACWADEGRGCAIDSDRTRTVQITVHGSRAPFQIEDLPPGVYAVVGVKDVDRDGSFGSADYVGAYSLSDGSIAGVTPPAHSIELRMQPVAAAQLNASTAPEPVAAPTLPRRAIKGGFHGLYIGVTKSVVANGVNPSAGIFWMPSRDWNAFFPDGRVYMGIPSHGLRDVDSWWDEACERAPVFCARYTVSGDIVRVTYQGGEEKLYVRDKDGTLWHERDSYLKVASLDGLRLDGTYVKSTRLDADNPGVIVFRRDGSFAEREFLYDINWDSVTLQPLTAEEEAGGTGTYVVQRNTLELRYADGRLVRTSIYLLPQNLKKLDRVEFNGFEFVRVK
ncbi:MAG TPA: hypothetical protein VE549_05265 [Myxococcaceae bacterium]|nr:hypothetical protein [Myxococcaceae bacterium]